MSGNLHVSVSDTTNVIDYVHFIHFFQIIIGVDVSVLDVCLVSVLC